jgi:glucosamine--fructose-6-phosphate aminotransferase (isomerizing)
MYCMKGLLEESQEIPARAQDCLRASAQVKLPANVPYIGMGSSYYAPLTLRYCGAPIIPFIASEYYYYLAHEAQLSGVLISQSGESSETTWCLEKFQHVISITDKESSTLGSAPNASEVVRVHSGPEHYSSTKSYINTLIALYVGLGIDPSSAVEQLQSNFRAYQKSGQEHAASIALYMRQYSTKGLYVIGSGPNHGTALQAALTLSETTKLTWVGMPVAQYDHGPKETANNTVVVILNAHGKDAERIAALKGTLAAHSNALIIEVEEKSPEILSPIPLIARLNWLMNYLADELEVGDTFALGGKVTKVSESLK